MLLLFFYFLPSIFLCSHFFCVTTKLAIDNGSKMIHYNEQRHQKNSGCSSSAVYIKLQIQFSAFFIHSCDIYASKKHKVVSRLLLKEWMEKEEKLWKKLKDRKKEERWEIMLNFINRSPASYVEVNDKEIYWKCDFLILYSDASYGGILISYYGFFCVRFTLKTFLCERMKWF